MKSAGKYLLAALFVTLLSGISISQDEYQPKYLLQDNIDDVSISGFGSYIIGFSDVDGSFAVYNGGGGAVLLNQTVYLGGYGMGLSTRHRYPQVTLLDNSGNSYQFDDLTTQFGHGGFWLGYIHESYKPIHFGASTKLGWGSIDLSHSNNFGDNPNDNYSNLVSDQVFVLTPQVEAEANLLRWFKINASVGYQIVTGIDQTYRSPNGHEMKFFDSKDFSSPIVNLSFVFGGFGGK